MFQKIGLNELLDLNLRDMVPLNSDSFTDKDSYYYYQVIKTYSRDELDSLAELAQSDEVTLAFKRLALLRLEIRRKNVKAKTIAELLICASNNQALNGEIYFVVGFAFESLAEHLHSRNYYRKSFEAFESAKVHKKAVKALHNVIAAESRIYPQKKFIIDYLYVASRAKKIKEFGIAGLACLNISREYQIIGAHDAALKFCNRALRLMENDSGGLQHCLAIVHRAHLLSEMKRYLEAKIDYQLASISPYPEVQSALKALDLITNKNSNDKFDKDKLLPTWLERVEQKGNSQAILGPVESKLISYLSEKPQDKFKLIELLYDSVSDHLSLENRLKVLINRVRKKRPGLIVFEDGKYRIADESCLTGIRPA